MSRSPLVIVRRNAMHLVDGDPDDIFSEFPLRSHLQPVKVIREIGAVRRDWGSGKDKQQFICHGCKRMGIVPSTSENSRDIRTEGNTTTDPNEVGKHFVNQEVLRGRSLEQEAEA